VSNDRIADRLDMIAEKQAEMGAQLREHMRRSAASEQNIELLRTQIKPLEQHVAFFGSAAKILGIGASVAGVVVGILRLLS
jgi:hypothetical protein